MRQLILLRAINSYLKDDTLCLLYEFSKNANVAVRTPVGKTERSILNAILQGDVFGPLYCSNQIDTFGKECIEEKKYLYKYKNQVEIPPLGMVDDLVCISECGHKTTQMNSYINYKTSSKKLQFGVGKCKKIHIGKNKNELICGDLYVDGWEVKEVEDMKTGQSSKQDIFEGEKPLSVT